MNKTDYCEVLWENRHYVKEIENANMMIDFAFGFGIACFVLMIITLFAALWTIHKISVSNKRKRIK